jgi:hypothetical protein
VASAGATVGGGCMTASLRLAFRQLAEAKAISKLKQIKPAIVKARCVLTFIPIARSFSQ